jgi:signal transduction histidine kinase
LPSIIESLEDFDDFDDFSNLAQSTSSETIKDPDGYLSAVIAAANEAKSLFEDALKKQNEINAAEQESAEKDALIVDVKELLSGLKPFLDLLRKELEVKVEISLPEEKVSTLISRKTLRRIIYNLVANAKDASANASPEDKVVTVSVEIYNTPGSNEQFVLLKVVDRGSGMDDDTKIKIFKPDPNKPFSTKENGSGYGIPNIKEYLDKNNGRIEVESEPGKGTTFSVYLSLERRTPDPYTTSVA